MPNNKENCMNKEELTADYHSRSNRILEIVERSGIGPEELQDLQVQLNHMANDQYWLGMKEANKRWKNHVSIFTVE